MAQILQAGTYGTALQAAAAAAAAAAHGAIEVIQLLVESEADVNAQGGHYGTALKAARAGESSVIVELLARNELTLVDIGCVTGYGRSLGMLVLILPFWCRTRP